MTDNPLVIKQTNCCHW